AAAEIPVSAEILFVALSRTTLGRLAQWDHGRNFEAIRTAWLGRALGVGGQIRVSLPTGERAGIFETIDDEGRLILRRSDGTREMIAAGDVFPVVAAPPPIVAAGR